MGCVAAGLMAAAGHVPLALPVLGFPGFALVIWLVSAAPAARAAMWRGCFAGLGYFAATLFWIVEPFLVDVARHGWMAPFALVFLAAGMALFWGAAAWLGAALGRGPAARAGVFAAALALAGLGRAYLLTGFPWALPAYIWTETPVIQLAAWTGAHGLGLLTLLAAALPGMAAARGRRAIALGGTAALGLVALGWGMGAARLAEDMPAPRDLRVRLVQPNAAQHLKWKPAMIPVFFERALALTAAPAARAPDLVVWPETAMPWLLSTAGPALEEMRAAAGPRATVAFGAQRRGDAGGFHNSLVVMEAGTAVPGTIYDKHHLVPFGEYMPFSDLAARLGIRGLAEQLGGGYAPGPGPRLVPTGGGLTALPLVCYEAVFPQDVFRAPVRPDYLLHVTNDAWFGQLAGPWQHLAQARVRTIEQGLPMLRAANTGISAVIDARGRMLDTLALGQAGHVDADLPGALPPTFYARWRDMPAFWAVALLLLALAAMRLRRISS
ncbi:apolipoprotein N-acyltransferase [Maritimibacter sp. 55A14]|nr:apolipoprotein N-acyltransferase [Maritimibacter sp. 55A14]